MSPLFQSRAREMAKREEWEGGCVLDRKSLALPKSAGRHSSEGRVYNLVQVMEQDSESAPME